MTQQSLINSRYNFIENKLFSSYKLVSDWALSFSSACFVFYWTSKELLSEGSLARLLIAIFLATGAAVVFCLIRASFGAYRLNPKKAQVFMGLVLGVFLLDFFYSYISPYAFASLLTTGVVLLYLEQRLFGQLDKKQATLMVGGPSQNISIGDFNKIVDFKSFCIKNNYTTVVLFNPDKRGNGLKTNHLIEAKLAGVHVLSYAQWNEDQSLKIDPEQLRPNQIVLSPDYTPGVYQKYAKRLFDLFFASVLLLLTWPVVAVCAILVHLQDKGPAFYSQKRVGRWGVEFDCYKLRTMVQNAESTGVAVWASKSDPRITPVGAFLRKTRIDEIPQLWSVIKGDMSIVGPRPERYQFTKELSTQISYYDMRHYIKPGLTGWAQIRYPYGASFEDAKQKHCYDLFYIKHQSFLFDLYILAETFAVVINKEGT